MTQPMQGCVQKDWRAGKRFPGCKSHCAPHPTPWGGGTDPHPWRNTKKTIQEVLKIITMQTDPPSLQSPAVFTNIVSFNPLILDLGSLQKTQLFPYRFLEREGNRCSRTDIVINKSRRLTLCSYSLSAPYSIFWAPKLLSLTKVSSS